MDDEPDEVVLSISAMANIDDEEEDTEALTFPMPIIFMGHGAGTCFLVSEEESPEMAGMDKVGLMTTIWRYRFR